MAEVVGLVASVITVAGFAAKVSKIISRARAFGEIPRQLYALKNEITDLEVVLRQMGDMIQDNAQTPDTQTQSLEQILERTKTHLADIAKSLERMVDTRETGNIKFISKSKILLKEKAIFQRYQDEIHGVKMTLSIMLGTSNPRDLRQIKLQLRQVTVQTIHSGQVKAAHPTKIIRDLSTHYQALNTPMDQQYQGLSDRPDTLGHLILKEGLLSEKGDDETSVLSEEVKNEPSKVDILRVQMSQRIHCRNWCPCSCHVKKKVKMAVPGMMESLLGKIFIGYAGLPVLSKSCDFEGCRDRQNVATTMEYWFPWWFVSMNLKLQLQYLPNAGPQMQLSTTRRVPDTSQSVEFALRGDISGLKHLFAHGLASPRDVSDSRGFTLLRWALYGGMHQYKTVQFLMSQGAIVDETSYEHAWDFIFRNKCTNKEEQELRCITQGGENDWMEEQNFPLVHRIVFGLSFKSLATELVENPNAIYVTDSQGRTALAWATARAQLADIALLVEHGADPNNMDVTGRTTVLHAVDSHSADCLRLVLEAGGDPNPITPKGLFRSSPLTAAARSGVPEMVRHLLRFNADPNACNPEGFTALHAVALTPNADCAVALLDFGADLNFTSSNGRTPLTTAIIYNSHQVLEIFVDHGYKYMDSPRFKCPPLLPITAEHADLETLSILASSHPMKLSYDLHINSLAQSRDILEKRRDYSEKLSEAFEELISIAQAEEDETGSVDSLMESAMFLSAKSSFHSELAETIAQLNSPTLSSREAWSDEESEKSVEEKGEINVGVSARDFSK